LAVLGLNLGRALGLNFGFFGPKFGQGSGPQFWQFWPYIWAGLWASILAILGLILGRALGLSFAFSGPKYGQVSGPQFWQFWRKFGFKNPLNFDQNWENHQNCQKLPNLSKATKIA